MRDSQSLLEQLLSFGGHRITVDDVHAMLGTADETRLASFAECMIQRNASGALTELDKAVGEGVDSGQLAEQLLGYLRDMMALTIGGPASLMRTANPNSSDSLREAGKAWGTMTLLSAMQMLDETIVRMKHSVQPRILLEVALVQICNLQDLQLLSDVVKALASGQRPPLVSNTPNAAPPKIADPPKIAVAETAPTASPKVQPTVAEQTKEASSPAVPPEDDSKKKEDDLAPKDESQVAEPTEDAISPDAPVSAANALELFRATVGQIEGVVQQAAWMTVEIQPISDRRWRVLLARDAKFAVEWFRKPENETLIRNAIESSVGKLEELEWVVTDRAPLPGVKPVEVPEAVVATPRVVNAGDSNQRIRDAMGHPLVQKFMTVFEGHVVRVDEPPIATIPPPKSESAYDGERDSTSKE
jgi:DNA polymerase-3 subunit gamma/tau